MRALRLKSQIVCLRIAAAAFVWAGMCVLHAHAAAQICEVAGPLALPQRKERPLIQTIDRLQAGTLRIEGRVWAERGTSSNDSKAAIVLVRFFGSDGRDVKPPGMPFSSYLKAYYRYLPTGEFKVQTVVPHGVTRARLEFLQWSGADDLALSLGSLRCSLEHEMFGDLLEFVEQHFILAAVLVIAVMLYQAKTVEPVLCELPDVRLTEIPGFTSEELEPSEADRHVLPADTVIDRRLYTAPNGAWFQVSMVFGGKSKSSIHRPELCLPGQGFQMTDPRDVTVGGVDWHLVTLSRKDSPKLGFAYTFFNQDGYRTSSHLRRIFRDVWDRSILGRIDRWAMVTVNASTADDRLLTAFLERLKGVVGR